MCISDVYQGEGLIMQGMTRIGNRDLIRSRKCVSFRGINLVGFYETLVRFRGTTLQDLTPDSFIE